MENQNWRKNMGKKKGERKVGTTGSPWSGDKTWKSPFHATFDKVDGSISPDDSPHRRQYTTTMSAAV